MFILKFIKTKLLTLTLIYIFTILLILSCSSEEKDLYNKTVDGIKNHLKTPSTANFQPFSEVSIVVKKSSNKEKYTIVSAFEKSLCGKIDEISNDSIVVEAIKKTDSIANANFGDIYTESADFEIEVEAENSFGALIKNNWAILAHRMLFNDGTKSKWLIVGSPLGENKKYILNEKFK